MFSKVQKLEQVVSAARDKGHIIVPLYQNKDDQRNIILNNIRREFESQTRCLKTYVNDIKELKDNIKLSAEEQRQYDSTDIQQKIVYGWMMAPLGLTTHMFGKLRSVYSTDACHAKTSLGGTFL